MVSLRDVSLRFPSSGRFLLDRVSLDLTEGMATGVTGPSGSGKTLLGLVAAGVIPGLIDAQLTGTVERSPQNAEQGNAAIVFQDPSFQLFSRNVRGELTFASEHSGRSSGDIQRDIDAIVEGLSLGSLLSRTPRDLSMGEIQRVAIGAALMQRPQVLVLDEPTQYMDPYNIRNTMEFVTGWRCEHGIAVLLIEHHLECLKTYCDTVYFLENGKISNFDGRKRELTRITVPEKASNETHIELHGVTYSYQETGSVLNDISLTLSKSEIVAILGPNGSGKSTLAKVLCGLYRPTTGTITHHDRPVKSSVSWYRSVGYVMQNPDHQLFAPTVFEECAYGPRNFDVPEQGYRVFITNALTDFHLEGYEERDPFTLSYGEKRRINIIGILAYDPHVLILDEPTCALDAANQVILLDQLERLNLAGKTIVIITHDIDFARAACTRAIFMRKGRIVRDCPVSELTEDDVVSLYTAG
jgi:energy-coupling factor transport system ATP-binding protein